MVVFFFKQKTAYEIKECDWSSDVCSSDLVVYSMAYGDQPALISELVDWARAIGFPVVCAGKGTKYLPGYHRSTPDTVWDHYGLTAEQAAAGGMNPQMFNSFLDGTKSAIEMAAVANACGLDPAPDGLAFPPCGVDDLAHVLRPRAVGGALHRAGTVEVISSEERDGRHVPGDLRWGVYVVFEAPDDYVRRCFAEYGVRTDASGGYAALYRPSHLIGLELGISVASAALRGGRDQTVTRGRQFRDWGDQQSSDDNDTRASSLKLEGSEYETGNKYTVWVLLPLVGLTEANITNDNRKLTESITFPVLEDGTYGSAIVKVQTKVATVAA